jgi:hypothetical protein
VAPALRRAIPRAKVANPAWKGHKHLSSKFVEDVGRYTESLGVDDSKVLLRRWNFPPRRLSVKDLGMARASTGARG